MVVRGMVSVDSSPLALGEEEEGTREAGMVVKGMVAVGSLSLALGGEEEGVMEGVSHN